MNNLTMPKLKLNMKSKHTKALAKKIMFIDIETSLVTAKVFRTGNQYVTAAQLQDQTRILTIAGGSLYDMETKGKEGVWSCSNHRSSNFKNDPLDDTEILATVWDIMDKAEVIVAHNARFDMGWLNGRFLELGWKIPSRVFVFCTYRNLTPYNLTSKKLDELSQTLVGNKKISTDMELWQRCSRGEKAAFEEMERYNIGDIYDTMFKVWKRTAYYNPWKAIDFTDYSLGYAQCRIDGSKLSDHGTYTSRQNGLSYNMYINKKTGTVYRDRCNQRSKKAGIGYIVPHI